MGKGSSKLRTITIQHILLHRSAEGEEGALDRLSERTGPIDESVALYKTAHKNSPQEVVSERVCPISSGLRILSLHKPRCLYSYTGPTQIAGRMHPTYWPGSCQMPMMQPFVDALAPLGMQYCPQAWLSVEGWTAGLNHGPRCCQVNRRACPIGWFWEGHSLAQPGCPPSKSGELGRRLFLSAVMDT